MHEKDRDGWERLGNKLHLSYTLVSQSVFLSKIKAFQSYTLKNAKSPTQRMAKEKIQKRCSNRTSAIICLKK